MRNTTDDLFFRVVSCLRSVLITGGIDRRGDHFGGVADKRHALASLKLSLSFAVRHLKYGFTRVRDLGFVAVDRRLLCDSGGYLLVRAVAINDNVVRTGSILGIRYDGIIEALWDCAGFALCDRCPIVILL